MIFTLSTELHVCPGKRVVVDEGSEGVKVEVEESEGVENGVEGSA